MALATPDPIHWATRWINEEATVDVTHLGKGSLQPTITRNTGLPCDFGKEYEKTDSKEVEPIDASVVAVLVYKDSGKGCVRVIGENVQNIIINREEDDHRRILVFIDSAKGEKGWIYGRPWKEQYERMFVSVLPKDVKKIGGKRGYWTD